MKQVEILANQEMKEISEGDGFVSLVRKPTVRGVVLRSFLVDVPKA
ncbi:hypothetical protein ACFSPU_02505 [Haoranjiania flava]|uniref:Uncharacterized protein n=1 Tax=Haoranjiania flava TaxID=1856322 RepID=A0AAE3LIZ3_9BACT|nr:hypothetical protein [Haoranjiania flava]MCU7693102.1 hypothetical protein [Haoranjiania flava]